MANAFVVPDSLWNQAQQDIFRESVTQQTGPGTDPAAPPEQQPDVAMQRFLEAQRGAPPTPMPSPPLPLGTGAASPAGPPPAVAPAINGGGPATAPYPWQTGTFGGHPEFDPLIAAQQSAPLGPGFGAAQNWPVQQNEVPGLAGLAWLLQRPQQAVLGGASAALRGGGPLGLPIPSRVSQGIVSGLTGVGRDSDGNIQPTPDTSPEAVLGQLGVQNSDLITVPGIGPIRTSDLLSFASDPLNWPVLSAAAKLPVAAARAAEGAAGRAATGLAERSVGELGGGTGPITAAVPPEIARGELFPRLAGGSGEGAGRPPWWKYGEEWAGTEKAGGSGALALPPPDSALVAKNPDLPLHDDGGFHTIEGPGGIRWLTTPKVDPAEIATFPEAEWREIPEVSAPEERPRIGAPPGKPPPPPIRLGYSAEAAPPELPAREGARFLRFQGKLAWFPSDEVLAENVTPQGWTTALADAIKALPGDAVRGTLAPLFPQWLATTAEQRLPLIYRQMESMRAQMLRQWTAWLDYEPHDFTIYPGGRLQGITPNEPRAVVTLWDVAEAPDAFEMSARDRHWFDEYDDLRRYAMYRANRDGYDFPDEWINGEARHVPRPVEAINGVEIRGQVSPEEARHYPTAEEGTLAGVQYSGDLQRIVANDLNYIFGRAERARMEALVSQFGQDPATIAEHLVGDQANQARVLLQGAERNRDVVDAAAARMAQGPAVGAGEYPNEWETLLRSDPALFDRAAEAAGMEAGAAKAQAFSRLQYDAAQRVIQAQRTFNAAQDILAAKTRWVQSTQHLPGEIFGRQAGAEIGVDRITPFGAGKVYPRDIADLLNQSFNAKANPVLQFASAVSNEGRAGLFLIDPALFSTHLPFALAADPGAAARALGAYFRSLTAGGRRFVNEWLTSDEWAPWVKRYVDANGTIGDSTSLLSDRTPLIARVPVFSTISRGANQAFSNLAAVGKISYFRGNWPRVEAGLMTGNQLARETEQLWLTPSLQGAGYGPNMRAAMSAFVLAPRLTAAAWSMAFSPLLGGNRGVQALKTLGLGYLGINAAALGYKILAGEPITSGFLDPNDTNEYLTIHPQGYNLSVGTPVTKAFRAAYRYVVQGIRDPGALDSLDAARNPGLQYLEGRGSASASFLRLALQAAAQAGGLPVRPTNYSGMPLAGPMDWINSIGHFFAPIGPGSLIPEVGEAARPAWAAAATSLGASVKMPSPAHQLATRREDAAQSQYGVPYRQLDVPQQDAINQATGARELRAESEARSLARGSDWARYQAEIGDAHKTFELAVAGLNRRVDIPLGQAGHLSGKDYRDALSHEVTSLQAVLSHINTTWAGKVPVTDEEKRAQFGDKGPPGQGPVYDYLQHYYDLQHRATDWTTGLMDVKQFGAARDALNAATPADVLQAAQTHLNASRLPELVQAQQQYAEYHQLALHGMSEEQWEAAQRFIKAMDAVRASSGATGKYAQGFVQSVAAKEDPDGWQMYQLYHMTTTGSVGLYWKLKQRQFVAAPEHAAFRKFYREE